MTKIKELVMHTSPLYYATQRPGPVFWVFKAQTDCPIHHCIALRIDICFYNHINGVSELTTEISDNRGRTSVFGTR